MKARMVHRGPDGQGTFADSDVVLGHRRLSIIDLKGGRQPISNEDGTVTVIANGEIYNHEHLRELLQTKGHNFSTQSDSEVLVHLWEDHKEKMVRELNGMFAFAIWDAKEKILFLSRDRFGQKPLYYTQINKEIIFASTLTSVTAHPAIRPILSKTAFNQYLAYEYVPSPRSIYKGIFKLDAGTSLTWYQGKTEIKRYWDYPLGSSRFKGSVEECAEEVERLLGQSIQRRLMSDVPLGVFLSGGIDSSSLVALMAQHIPPDRIKTFTIGFFEKSFDESRYAERVARHFGTDHRTEMLTEKRLIQILPEVIQAYDEPFADASSLPTYLLSRFTRQHVTVALGGDGADELFAGYDAFAAHRLAGWFNRLPKLMRTGMTRFMNKLPPTDTNMSLPFLAKRFLGAVKEDPVMRNHLWLGVFDGSTQKKLLSPDFIGRTEPLGGSPFMPEKNIPHRHDLEAVIYAYINTYLKEGILTKVDRASMIHSLEVRAPFLDHELGEFSASIPFDWKLKGLNKKFILKKALNTRLPKFVLSRAKRGFGIPKALWLRTCLRPYLEECFSEKALNTIGIFSTKYIRKMMADHFSGTSDYQKELWTLLMFELWRKQHGGVFSP